MKRIIHHIRKHHKKYIFAAGAVSGLLLVKIITVILVFFGISIISGKSEASGGFEEKALLTFSQIEEIAHKRDILLHKIGKEHFAIWEANFHKMEEEYHNEDDLMGKFEIAQKIDSLIHRQAGFTELQKYVTPAEAEKFQLLEDKFDSLYNHKKTIPWEQKSEMIKQEALKIFVGIFDIAKQRDDIIHILGEDNFLAWEVTYHDSVSRFKKAQSREEQHELTHTISDLLYRQDEYFKQEGYIGPQKYITDEEEKNYQQTQNEFEELH